MPKINFSKLKSSTFIGVVCVAVGLVCGFILPSAVKGLSSATVVRAKSTISSGTKITSNMLEQVKQGSTNLPAGTLHSLKDAVGEYAVTDILPSDNLTKAKVTKTDPAALKDGQMKMSVAIKNFAAGVSGKLQAGDVVSVFCPQSIVNNVQSGGSSIQPAIYPQELQYVKVAAVTASTGKDTNPSEYNKTTSSGSTTGNTSNLPATVTLIVNAKQAAILAGMDNQTVHLAYVCSGNDKQAAELLAKQEQVINQEAVVSSTPAASSATSSGVSK